jgi:hypothetical protein
MPNPIASRSAFGVGLTLLTLLFITACNTTPAPEATPANPRIAEHQADYAAQPDDIRQQLTEGLIARGQTMKLVYVALGRPDRIVTTPDAKTVTWTYHNYVPPFHTANKVVKGKESLSHLEPDHPLNDVFEAWRHGLQRREYGGNPLDKGTPIPKEPNQSWSDYARYRRTLEGAGTAEAKLMVNARAKEEVKELRVIDPVTAPTPVKLEVVFIDRVVADAIVNDSTSAFSPSP